MLQKVTKLASDLFTEVATVIFVLVLIDVVSEVVENRRNKVSDIVEELEDVIDA